MIYLASPYTHPDRGVMHQRYEVACQAVAQLCTQGAYPYSPIVHFHPVAVKHQLPTDFLYWKKINFDMIELADMLMVLPIDGWEESVGVQSELEHARKRGIPVETFKWQ